MPSQSEMPTQEAPGMSPCDTDGLPVQHTSFSLALCPGLEMGMLGLAALYGDISSSFSCPPTRADFSKTGFDWG